MQAIMNRGVVCNAINRRHMYLWGVQQEIAALIEGNMFQT
jgi:hypothetical protein